MGQKSNPNSFQLPSKTAFFSGNTFNTLEYSTFFKEHYSISSVCHLGCMSFVGIIYQQVLHALTLNRQAHLRKSFSILS